MRESMSPTVALVGRVSEVTSSWVHRPPQARSIRSYPIAQVMVTTEPAARYSTVTSSTRPLITASPRRSWPLRSTLSTRSSSSVRSNASSPSASGAGRPTESATSTEKLASSSISLNSTGDDGAWARLKRTANEHASLTASLISSSRPSATPARRATDAAMKRAVVGTDSLQTAHQNAKTGRVEKLDVLHVDNDVVIAGGNQVDELFAQLGRGVDVDLATDDDNSVFAFCAGRQRQIHCIPPACNRTRAGPSNARRARCGAMSTRLATNLTTPGVIFPSRCGDADVRACPRRLRIPSSSDAKLGLVSAESYSSNPPPRPVGPARSCEHVLERLVRPPGRRARVTHVEVIAARLARSTPWPGWVCPEIVSAYAQLGIEFPWEHQVEAAELARLGQHVVIASGTASGKSLAYQLPVLQALTDGTPNRGRLEPATALYLSPTKALAADQLRALDEVALPGIRAATYDGDTPYDERSWIRTHANLVLANPDLVHCSMLPSHRQWAPFLRGLRYVVIDECHGYRGVFGAHVAQVIRRLRRVAARYGSYPVFVLASATVSEPAVSASRLIGLEVMAVTDDASPRGASRFVLWEPPLMAVTGHRFDADRDDDGVPHEATVRRSTSAETADLLADLVIDGVRTLAFVRSRRGAEAVALAARRALDEVGGNLGRQVAAYRAGYLPEERRALERALRHGTIVGLAATTALELGVDVSGLDAVLLAGFPGTRASMWQQAGRAGRAGQES